MLLLAYLFYTWKAARQSAPPNAITCQGTESSLGLPREWQGLSPLGGQLLSPEAAVRTKLKSGAGAGHHPDIAQSAPKR